MSIFSDGASSQNENDFFGKLVLVQVCFGLRFKTKAFVRESWQSCRSSQSSAKTHGPAQIASWPTGSSPGTCYAEQNNSIKVAIQSTAWQVHLCVELQAGQIIGRVAKAVEYLSRNVEASFGQSALFRQFKFDLE